MRKYLIFLLLLGCTKSAYLDPNIIVVAIDSAPRTLDPRYATDANGQRIIGLMFQSLVRMGDQLEIVPELANEWSYKDLIYSFTISKNWYFSNGEPIQSEDILFSFNEFRKVDSPFRSSLEIIESIKVTEKDEAFILEIKLKEFSATFLTDLIPVKILPRSVVSDLQHDFARNLISSGYYFLEKRDINLYVLKKNPHYPNSPVKTNEIHFKVIQDDSTRYLKLRKGEVDLAQSVISPSRLKDFKTREDFKTSVQAGLSMNYMLVNLNDDLLKDINLRRAIAHAIDIEEIIKYKLEGFAQPATSILSPNNFFHNKDLEPIKHNLEKAKSFAKNLKPNTEITIKTSNSIEAIENARILANQLQKIGLRVKIQSFEWGTFYGDITSGNFQLALMRWVGATDPDIYRVALHSSEVPPGRNRGNFKNKKLDQLLEKGIRESDINKRKSLYDEAQKIVLEELPYIPLWYNQQISIHHTRLNNYYLRSNGDFLGLIHAYKEAQP